MATADEIKRAKLEFARNGFTQSPLTDEQIAECIDAGVEPYGVGCDVNAGFEFGEALAANR